MPNWQREYTSHTHNIPTNFNDGSSFHMHSRTRNLPAALGAGRLLEQQAKFEYKEKTVWKLDPQGAKMVLLWLQIYS